ncbi:MAG: hypothetical protein M3O28_09705 [Actinomycetota bacterium]|nr:hypothetical protein [Actinomycetota bacterium]
MTSDPRAAVEYRIPAMSLKTGDLVNTSPGEDDWQEVLRAHKNAASIKDPAMRALVESLGGRYVVVELTDLAPVDAGVYFADADADAQSEAMIYATDDTDDERVADVVSAQDGVRIYLYTKYELVTVRAAA